MSTIDFYMSRMGHKNFDRMVVITKWVEAQFGRPDYHTNYNIGFGDDTDNWVKLSFYNHTQAFWTQNRFPEMLTKEQWELQTMRWGG